MSHEHATKPARTTNHNAPSPRPRDTKKQISPQPSTDRLGPVPDTVSLGEPITGMEHSFTIAMPANLGGGPYSLHAESDDTSFRFPMGPYEPVAETKPGSKPRSLAVFYRFDSIGRFQAAIELKTKWADGHEETRTIHIVGRARASNQLPGYREPVATDHSPATRELEEARYQEDQKRTDPYPQNHKNTLDTATSKAQNAAATLAAAQQRGLKTVNQEALGYKPPPPMPRSLWWDLAELALTLGTAGVARVAAQGITTFLVKAFTPSAEAVSQRIKDEALDSGLDKVIGKFAEKSVDSRIVQGLQDAIKDGLKLGGKTAVKAGIPAADRGTNEHQFSTDAGIAFFEGQYAALDASSAEHRNLVTDREQYLRPLLRSDPELAIAGMRSIEAGMVAAEAKAEEEQAKATSAQWLAYKTRARLGVEAIDSGRAYEPKLAVSKMDEALPANPKTNEKNLDGVLDIDVNGAMQVSGAYASGIARPTVAKIAGIDLRAAKVPLRIVIGRHNVRTAVITLDEGGRLRVSGDFTVLRGEPSSEHAALPAAQALVEQVLSKTLREWGVVIHTDDAANR